MHEREFCIRRGKALRVAGKRGMCKQQSLRCILKAAPPVRLSTELARLAGEDTSSVDANVADCLRLLFVKLICKYRKVRQADFFKVLQRKNRDERDSLMRHLKNI